MIKYLYNLIDSLRLRSYKKIRHIKNENITQAPCLPPFVTRGAFECFVKKLLDEIISSFTKTTAVINGCSELILQLCGEDAGRHASIAMGVATTPFDLPVIIAAEAEISKWVGNARSQFWRLHILDQLWVLYSILK